MSDRDDTTTSSHETAVKQLLRRVARRRRPSQNISSDVPHHRETDPNREFASHGEPNGVVWFFLFLPGFVIAYVICLKIGAL
ncbi:hypothetical protein ACVWZ4_007459 [Bradyrhizobium sp. USDA 4472]